MGSTDIRYETLKEKSHTWQERKVEECERLKHEAKEGQASRYKDGEETVWDKDAIIGGK